MIQGKLHNIDLVKQLFIPEPRIIEKNSTFGDEYEIKDLQLKIDDYKTNSMLQLCIKKMLT
jgi:hypothetical protein